MRFAFLGKTGLRVPELSMGFGTMVGTEEIDQKIGRCMDAGVCLFDTADAYSDGHSEATLGQALVGKRQSVLLSTKASYRVGPGENDLGSSRHHLVNACEASLKRLRTDWIDLYQLHGPDAFTHPDETMRAMDDLVRSGKVRYIGCSNYSGWHIMKALGVSDARHQARFVSQQIYYSLQGREAEYELLPISLDQGLGVMVWSPLAGGLLTGKYRRGKPQPNSGRHLQNWGEPPIYDENKLYDTIEVLVAIAEARKVPAAQVAMAWTLGRPAIATLVIGVRNEDQLKANLPAADLKLTAEERDKLDAVSAPTLIYPYWHQASTARERLGAADLALLEPFVRGEARF